VREEIAHGERSTIRNLSIAKDKMEIADGMSKANAKGVIGGVISTAGTCRTDEHDERSLHMVLTSHHSRWRRGSIATLSAAGELAVEANTTAAEKGAGDGEIGKSHGKGLEPYGRTEKILIEADALESEVDEVVPEGMDVTVGDVMAHKILDALEQ
jgi:hypothetical protein